MDDRADGKLVVSMFLSELVFTVLPNLRSTVYVINKLRINTLQDHHSKGK
jgi:hypothetical protein